MQERAEVTRRAVLATAAVLFEQHGYVGTSISDVARTSGYTSGAIYFHFGSKEGLARGVLEAHFAEWPRYVEHWESQNAPVLDRLVGLSLAVAREFRDNVIVRAGNRLWSERRTIPVSLPRPFVGWIDATARMLTAATEAGELAPGVDAERAARVLVASFFGTHTVSDALDDRRNIEDAVSDLWMMLLPGLQAAPVDPASCLERARKLLAGTRGQAAAAALSHED
ncbi:TetR/AcrR family transcriptional regulator [Streptomyces sp. NBC_01478]|uniref:ScbR family autoregulator-binding transcription factor n=1 Tax=Streptomyces sp. NBC_01478 TaxID=2903882 RepID=UPI002E32BACF|nr:ScbR family autoregulator-binding transcription factor [Streptomyces sp. NBC_01478]